MHQRDEVGLSRHFVDNFDARPMGHFCGERTDFSTRGDLDANQRRQTDAPLADGVTTDGAVFLEFADVGANGSFAGSDFFGQIHVRDASVGAEGSEDGSVDFSDAGHEH